MLCTGFKSTTKKSSSFRGRGGQDHPDPTYDDGRSACVLLYLIVRKQFHRGNKSQHLHLPPCHLLNIYLFQSCDLLANEEVERHLGYEEAGSSAIGVVDGRSDVLVCEPLERVDGGQAMGKYLVKDVAAVPKPIQRSNNAGSSRKCRQTFSIPNKRWQAIQLAHAEPSRPYFYPVPHLTRKFKSYHTVYAMICKLPLPRQHSPIARHTLI